MGIHTSLHLADQVGAYVRDLIFGEAVFRAVFDLVDERVVSGGDREPKVFSVAQNIDVIGGHSAVGVLLGFHAPPEIRDRSPGTLGTIAAATPRAIQAAMTRAHARLLLRTVPDADQGEFVRAWAVAAGDEGSPAACRKLLERNVRAARGEFVIGVGHAIRLGLDRTCLEILGDVDPGLAHRVAHMRWRQAPTAALIRRRLAGEANRVPTTAAGIPRKTSR